MSWVLYKNSVAQESGDDITRIVTYFNQAGGVKSTRPYTEQENLAAEENIKIGALVANESNLIDKATQAVNTNLKYLALVSTTTAQDKAQIKALSRQVNALIKLITKSLDDNTGT